MGSDFDSDKKYNFENNVSMIFEINKTCYSKGEMIYGSIVLTPKDGLVQTQLINPFAKMTLKEHHYYEYYEYHYDSRRNSSTAEKRVDEENIIIFSLHMDFSTFNGANILTGLQIPFQIQIPVMSYPSCFFEPNAYVRHFLTCDFPAIEARKSVEIIIKNNMHFSSLNGLLKTPAVLTKEITKHKYAFFNYGSFKTTITLPKNIFAYTESIPFIIEIDCQKLSLNIKGLYVSINRTYKKNHQKNHLYVRSYYTTEIVNKTIPLMIGENLYHLDDTITLPVSPPEINPVEVYKILDADKRKHDEKFKKIKLFPTCYGGLLSCEYFLKVIVQMDTLFSTNEEFILPIDIYEPYIMTNTTTGQQFTPQQYFMNNGGQNITYCTNEIAFDKIPQVSPQTQINGQNDFEDENELPSIEEILSQKNSNNNINNNNENNNNENSNNNNNNNNNNNFDNINLINEDDLDNAPPP
jgi:hypothetical protein